MNPVFPRTALWFTLGFAVNPRQARGTKIAQLLTLITTSTARESSRPPHQSPDGRAVCQGPGSPHTVKCTHSPEYQITLCSCTVTFPNPRLWTKRQPCGTGAKRAGHGRSERPHVIGSAARLSLSASPASSLRADSFHPSLGRLLTGCWAPGLQIAAGKDGAKGAEECLERHPTICTPTFLLSFSHLAGNPGR